MNERSGEASGERVGIEYRPARFSLGWMMVGQSDRGICSLTLGDDPDQLLEDLRGKFPESDLTPGGDSMEALCRRLVAVAEKGEDGLDLPIDAPATDFQSRVWEAMREIPTGETRSYRQLAEMAGYPKASRAVGTVCARNPVSLLIPCHRVVQSDGSIGNYAWGAGRKAALLRVESFC